MRHESPRAAALALARSAQHDLRCYLEDGKSVIASSSFQTHSIPMLSILAEVGSIPVYFLDTGFHFPETLTYRDEIADLLGIEVISLRSTVTKLAQTTAEGSFYFTEDPDYCCHLNKTAPMDLVARQHDVWISGVRRDQNTNRSTFESVMEGPDGSIRYHPMLDWNDAMITDYLARHEIPPHPLDEEGYVSIGCAPCTKRATARNGSDHRGGRWAGQEKTECGLHLDLVVR